jgi:hypothetical protein
LRKKLALKRSRATERCSSRAAVYFRRCARAGTAFAVVRSGVSLRPSVWAGPGPRPPQWPVYRRRLGRENSRSHHPLTFAGMTGLWWGRRRKEQGCGVSQMKGVFWYRVPIKSQRSAPALDVFNSSAAAQRFELQQPVISCVWCSPSPRIS